MKATLEKILLIGAKSMFMVSVFDVLIKSVKSKSLLRGIDHICTKQLIYGIPLLLSYLVLLFQVVFTKGIVPPLFSTDCLTPDPKKNKPLNEC